MSLGTRRDSSCFINTFLSGHFSGEQTGARPSASLNRLTFLISSVSKIGNLLLSGEAVSFRLRSRS